MVPDLGGGKGKCYEGAARGMLTDSDIDRDAIARRNVVMLIDRGFAPADVRFMLRDSLDFCANRECLNPRLDGEDACSECGSVLNVRKIVHRSNLSQRVVDAIAAAGVRESKQACARRLGVPESWVWRTRNACGITAAKPESVAEARAFFDRHGLVVPDVDG